MSRNDVMATAKFLLREVFPRFRIPDKLSSDNGVAQYLRIKKKRWGAFITPNRIGSEGKWDPEEETSPNLTTRMQTNLNTHLTPQILTGHRMPCTYLRGP